MPRPVAVERFRAIIAKPSADRASRMARRESRRGRRPVTVDDAVALDTDVGSLLLPSYDRVMVPWIVHHGTWEPAESEVLRSFLRPGMTFLDVGAHVGYFSLLASRLVGPAGRVIAVEPHPQNFALLLANLDCHGAANVRALPAAAWSRTEWRTLGESPDNSGDHHVTVGAGGVVVPALALDDVLVPPASVDAVKVDVQGADHHAVFGMASLLARCQPLVLAEFWPDGVRRLGESPVAVVAGYRAAGCRLSIIDQDTRLDDLSDEAVVAVAEAAPGGFCTLRLDLG